MKRITALILILLLLCGCSVSGGDNAESHAQITINLPADNTVNGYRESGGSSSMPDTISADEVEPDTAGDECSCGNSAVEYVGNANSHIFHKTSCDAICNMKEKNKVTFKSREDAVNSGYSPCKRCNP